MGHIGSNVNANSSVNEQQVQENHDQAYNQGNASNMSASAMGSAAAIQAFKSFASGGGLAGLTGGNSNGNGNAQGSSGSMVSKLIGMAMSEASKLFDKSGGAASGDKQDAVSSAGATMMKLMVQNQISGVSGFNFDGLVPKNLLSSR